jgi:hypothetical protein
MSGVGKRRFVIIDLFAPPHELKDCLANPCIGQFNSSYPYTGKTKQQMLDANVIISHLFGFFD